MDDIEGINDSSQYEILATTSTYDAVDFFTTLLSRRFPDLSFEMYAPRKWRPGWTITMPAQAEYTTEEVVKAAEELQDRFFWEMEVLVPFTVEREGEEEEDD